MATTVVPAALTVTIEEKITLNGLQRGNEQKLTISGVKTFDSRILTVNDGSNLKLASFSSGGTGAGSYDSTKVAYVRVTNLDATATIDLFVEETVSTCSAGYFTLGPGKSFLLGKAEFSTASGFSAGSPTTPQTELDILSGIYARCSASVDVELVVAST